MNRIKHILATYAFLGILITWPFITDAQQDEPEIDPETWVYESVIKDGKLQFKTFGEWTDSQSMEYRPLTIFVDSKLGCKPAIDAIRVDNLSSDWFWRTSGAPQDLMEFDNQYVVAEGYAFKNATSKSLMILDVVNRWAAFAMTHSKDHWNHENGAPRHGREFSAEYQKKYFVTYFSLFLVDNSSEMFRQDAMLIARLWFENYGIGGKPGLGMLGVNRIYLDEQPMTVYEIRCDVEQ